MAIDSSASQVATNALQAIPFGAIIGAPLKACIEAQALAAQTSWNFIKEVGLNTKEDGQKEAINVAFQFMKDGRMVQLNVPLLTIVPIPYISIKDIDIAFKANISASSSSFSENTESQAIDAGGSANATIGKGPFKMSAEFKANYSSKKDSKATQSSQYSVEYTMDVAVKAGQDGMPAGMAKVLELLGSSLSVEEVNGQLGSDADTVEVNKPLKVTYRNSNGLYEPTAIEVDNGGSLEVRDNNAYVTFKTKGLHKVTANGNTIEIEATEAETANA